MTTIGAGLTDLVSSYGLSTLVKATVILLVTLAVVRVAHRGRASVRHLVLVAGFAGLLGLPIAIALAPPVAVDLAPMPVFIEDDIALSAVPANPTPVSGTPVVDTRSAFSRWNLTAQEVIALVWFIGIVVFATPVLLGLVQIRRLQRTGLPWDAGQRLVDALASEAGVRRRVDVLRHEAIAAPATSGVGRHTILFPLDVDAWADADVVCAAVHEVEHVRRADCLVNAVTRVICAIYWVHPLVWIAWRRLGLEAERACDDAVLRRAEAATYADQLVTLAGRLSGNARHPLLAMANRSDLVRRVAAVLDPRQARGHAGAAASVAIVIGATVLIATLSPLQAVHSAAGLAIGQDAGGDIPSFEVATIRVNRSGDRRASHDIVPASGRLTITNVTVRDLIQEAYGVPLASQLVNVPEWASRTRVDVVARAASPAPARMLQRMLQPFLAEHFKLVVRRETRDMEVFAMVAANPGQLGPQLRRNDAACDDLVGTAGGFARAPEGASNEKGTCGILPGGAGRIVARGLDMAGLAAFIGTAPGRMVIDRAGLTGRFDVDLTYTPSAFSAEALAQRPGAAPPPGVDPSGPSLLTALREQLGLRLDAVRAPVEVLVIERAEPLSVDAPAAGPAAQAPPFDVTSVKRNTSGETRIRFETPPGRMTAVNVPIRFLIRQAYRLPEVRIIGGPSWLDTDRFDVLATTTTSAASSETIRQMLRALLAERFGLVVHTEAREMPIYALVVDKDDGRLGPNLRRSATECGGRGGTMVGGRVQCGILVSQGPGSGSLRGGGATIAEFVRLFGDFLNRPVVDNTGLSGTFDFELQFTAERSALPGAGVPGGLTTAADDEIPSLFTALQEQLGLKLNAQRGTTDVLVIDRVSQPSES